MKKALSICLFLSLMAGCLLTGCGNSTTDDSSDNKKASECFIDHVYMPIYDEPQDILEFNFPLTMTQEELLANSGEPDPDNIYTYQSDDSDYHSESYTYEKEAEKYYGNSSYKFEFANDVLAYVTISYTP